MNSNYMLMLIASILVTSVGGRADTIGQDGILRNDDGRILHMNHRWAMKACPQGTHLPTIRELTELSQASGAKGILEKSQVDPLRIPMGYRKVSAVNPDGKWDEFFFNEDGYEPSSEEIGNNWFWSSSSAVYGFSYCYALRDNGDPYWVRHYSSNAVRCIVDQ